MRNLLLLAGAGALLALGAPAAADAKPGKGKGHSAHVVKVKPAKVKVAKVKARTWLTGCPPGLVWRGPSCVPPGHANSLLNIGTRVPLGWAYTPWGAVPLSIRDNYEFASGFRYIHRDGVVYAVNPRTRVIAHILTPVL